MPIKLSTWTENVQKTSFFASSPKFRRENLHLRQTHYRKLASSPYMRHLFFFYKIDEGVDEFGLRPNELPDLKVECAQSSPIHVTTSAVSSTEGKMFPTDSSQGTSTTEQRERYI